METSNKAVVTKNRVRDGPDKRQPERFESHHPLWALALILKVWLVFCVLWSVYICLIGDIRFLFFKRQLPEDHWMTDFVIPFEYLGIPFIGNLLRLIIMWGVAIPFALAYYFTKRLYNNRPLIDSLIYIILLQAILYVTSVTIDYTLSIVCESKLLEILNDWRIRDLLDYFIRWDLMYMHVFAYGALVATIEILIRNWRQKNATT